jgi:hypothetical protein
MVYALLLLLISGNTTDIAKDVTGKCWGKVTVSYFCQFLNNYKADINLKKGGGKFTII